VPLDDACRAQRKSSVAAGSQPFELVFQAKFFFLQCRDTHFVPSGMSHFGFNQFLDLPVPVRDFPDVRFYGHRFSLFWLLRGYKLEHPKPGFVIPCNLARGTHETTAKVQRTLAITSWSRRNTPAGLGGVSPLP
jgi:hypothetical protein